METPIRYDDDVERVQDGEDEAIDRTVETMRHTMAQTFEQHRHATCGWAAEHASTWSLGVQLRTDVNAMPVEDASVEWPQDRSEYRTVATVTLPPQDAFSAPRRVFAEDRMGWRPWNGLVAHRPLGSINRVRRRAYHELGRWRAEQNAVDLTEPVSAADVPA